MDCRGYQETIGPSSTPEPCTSGRLLTSYRNQDLFDVNLWSRVEEQNDPPNCPMRLPSAPPPSSAFFRNSLVPLLAIVPRFFASSSRLIPIPVSPPKSAHKTPLCHGPTLTSDDDLPCRPTLIEHDFDCDVCLARGHDVPVGQSGKSELFERIIGVGEELAEEDVLVRVERVDDKRPEAGDVRLRDVPDELDEQRKGNELTSYLKVSEPSDASTVKGRIQLAAVTRILCSRMMRRMLTMYKESYILEKKRNQNAVL